jgi:hypothetical protein
MKKKQRNEKMKKIKFEAEEEISFPSDSVRKIKNWYQMMDLVGALGGDVIREERE